MCLKIDKAVENVNHPLRLKWCSYTNRAQPFRHHEQFMEDVQEERDHVHSVQGADFFFTPRIAI